jgi:transcriptional regulator with XRE-family HTH domain
MLLAVRDLGSYLRGLRHRKQKSLKAAAPELGVSASYLSKMETGRLVPPPDTVEKIARYYGAPAEGINALAGRLPEDVVRILQGNPDEAIRLLREKFGGRR